MSLYYSQIMFSNKIGQKLVQARSHKKRVRIVQTETDEHLIVKKSQISNRASFQQQHQPKYIDPFSKTSFKQPSFPRKILKPSNRKQQAKHLKTQPDQTLHKPVSQPISIPLNKYQIDGVAGKGTFGTVYIGHIRGTGEKVAIKKVLQDKRYKNRELEILKILNNDQVLEMRDYYMSHENEQEYLNVVMNYYPYNLYQVLKKKQFTPVLLKLFFFQILKGLNYLTSQSIAHRDIKPQNILVDLNSGKAVICDFGSAKKLVQGQPNLAYICSRCYRAPQLIFGAGDYTCQIDMWSVGCVLVEMINGNPPFLGESQIDQLIQIIKVLGTPSKEQVIQMNKNYDIKEYAKFPNVKPTDWRTLLRTKDLQLIDLVTKILQYSPKRRITAAEAIMHPFFDELKNQERLKEITAKYKGCSNIFKFNKQQFTLLKNSSEIQNRVQNKKNNEMNYSKMGIRKVVNRV